MRARVVKPIIFLQKIYILEVVCSVQIITYILNTKHCHINVKLNVNWETKGACFCIVTYTILN